MELLSASGMIQRVELGPMSLEEIRTLAMSRLGFPAPASLVDFLWEQAGGNPGRTDELLRACARQGAIVEHDDHLGVRAERFADVVAEVAGNHLSLVESLSTAARNVLAALAVSGTPMTVAELGRVALSSGKHEIAELIRATVVQWGDDDRLVVHPPSLARSIRSSLDPLVRESIHRALADLPGSSARRRFHHLGACHEVAGALAAAEQAFSEDSEPRLAAAAALLAETANPSVAARWRARAAHAYRSGGSYKEAVQHLVRQLDLETDPRSRSAAWVALSTALLRSGQVREVPEAVDRALAEPPEKSDQARLLANRAAAWALLGERNASLRDADDALALAGEARDELGAAMASDVHVRFAMVDGRFDDAERWAARSADAYRVADNAPGTIRALGMQMRIALSRGAPDHAEVLGNQAIAMARQCANRLPLVEQLLQHAIVLAESGQWLRAMPPVVEARRLAIEDGRPIEAATATAHLAQLEGLLGNARAASRHARRAVRLASRFQPGIVPYAWRSLAQAERIRGRLVPALTAANRALVNGAAHGGAEEMRWCRIEYGRVCATAGRWAEAESAWNEALPVGNDWGASGAMITALAARAALRRSDRTLAETRSAAVGQWLSTNRSPLAAAHAALLDAEIALTRSPSEGLKAAEAALDAFSQLPAPADRARAIVDMAQLVPLSGAVGAVFSGWLDQAERTFERLGNHLLRERALSIHVDCLKSSHRVVHRDTGLIERVSWLVGSITDLDELTRRAMRAAVEQLGAERGVLLLIDPESGELTPVADYGAVEPATRNEAVRYSGRVVRHATEGGDSLLIVDTRRIRAQRRRASPICAFGRSCASRCSSMACLSAPSTSTIHAAPTHSSRLTEASSRDSRT